MDREDRYDQQHNGRDTYQGDKGAKEDRNSAEDLGGNGEPRHQVRCRNSDRVQDRGKGGRAFGPLRETVCQKTVACDEPNREHCIWRKPSRPGLLHLLHFFALLVWMSHSSIRPINSLYDNMTL